MFLSLFSVAGLTAQVCLDWDTITSGNGSGIKQTYYYNSYDLLTKVERTDSGSYVVNVIDTLYYTGTQLDSMVSFYQNSSVWYRNEKVTYTYTGGMITRILSENDLSSGSPSAMAHDITYNGNNQIDAITLDTSSIMGTPGGFMGSFLNIQWDANGNITTLTMDQAGTPLSLTCTFDSKNNLQRLLPKKDAPSIMLGSTQNNLTMLVVAVLGTGIDRDFTYDSNDEVTEMIDNTAAFSSGNSTQYYYKACSGTSVETLSPIQFVKLYPNPSFGRLTLSTGSTGAYRVYNLNGEVVHNGTLLSQQNQIDLSHLSEGSYVISVMTNDKVVNVPYYIVK